MIDSIAATRFLAAIARQKDATFVWQLWPDVADKDDPRFGRNDLKRVLIGPFAKHKTVLEKLNAASAGIAPQINRGPRSINGITVGRALFIDNDDPKKKLDLTACAPSITVESSPNKQHYYWLLDEEIPIGEWVRAQKALATQFGTDPTMSAPNRIMRLPGTMHMKDPTKATRVRLLECFPDRRYTVGEVIRRLAPNAATSTPSPRKKAKPPELHEEDITFEVGDDTVTLAAEASVARIKDWLERRQVDFRLAADGVTFRLTECPFNADHRDMSIRVFPTGAIWAGCFHATCGSNAQMWGKVKDKIGGWSAVAAGGFVRGDHVEVAERMLLDLASGEPSSKVIGYGSEGLLWRYVPLQGIWESLSRPQQVQHLRQYAGVPVGVQRKPLALFAGDLSGIPTAAYNFSYEPFYFANKPPGIAFENGFLTLERAPKVTLKLLPHAADQRQVERFPFAYVRDAEAPRFARYLREVFLDDADAELKIALLQEFVGACLFGLATAHQMAVMLTGEGDNGKSVFLKVIAGLFPDRLRTSVRPQMMSNPYYRCDFATARINIVSEVPESEIVEAEAFKAITAGEEIDARQPRERVIRVRPIAGHLMACNRLPATTDFTRGFWRRWVVISFNRTFTTAEKETALEHTILETEIPGIVAWAARGVERLAATNSYTEPPSSEAAKQGWRRATDPVASFVEEATEMTERAYGTDARQLYAAYRDWAEENGHNRMTRATFQRRLAAFGVPFFIRDNQTVFFLRILPAYVPAYPATGIIIKDPEEPDDSDKN